MRRRMYTYAKKCGPIYLCLLLMSLIANPVLSQTTDVYPKPISESAEISAPGKMTILSYPKYYKNAQDQLTEVDTTLVPSNDPDWDYEVTTGIWTLKVRGDGTFQAQHVGDIFTYRFQSLGYGRGSNYRPFDLGQADWSSIVVLGDTIRWVDVYPNVDVSVRYIHDILKVDVIVKKEKLREIKQAVLNGELNPDDYLTARFDIPQVLITSQAHKGKDTIDVYQERLNIDTQPIEFKKNDKTIHRLRLVESYISDEKGMPIRFVKGNNVLMDKVVIRSAQSWQLRRNEEGIAEMSSNLGDLLDAPDGDLIIDPIMDLTLANGNTIQDTYLDYWNGNGYGSSSMLYVDRAGGQPDGDHTLIGFGFTSTDLGLLKGANVTSAKLQLYCSHTDLPYGAEPIRPYRVTQEWNEFSASWTARTSGSNWNQGGGDFSDPDFQGKPLTITTGDRYSWVKFDVTYAFKKHIIEDPDYVEVLGFLLKYVENNYVCVGFNSRDHANNRPELEIEYSFTQFGNDPGLLSTQLEDAAEDNYKLLRMFFGGTDPWGDNERLIDLWNYNQSLSKDVKLILVFGCGNVDSSIQNPQGIPGKDYWKPLYPYWWTYDGTWQNDQGYEVGYGQDYRDALPEDYKDYVNFRLTHALSELQNPNITTPAGNSGNSSATLEDVVAAIEIGNEEDAKGWDADATQAGEYFAEYYMAAADMLRNNWSQFEIIGGGSIENSRGLNVSNAYSVLFLKSYIDEVKNTDWDLLPDTIAIHGYDGQSPPEYNTGSNASPWPERLTHLLDICNAKGFIPNFAVTEYGYCATYNSGYSNIWGYTDASDTKHAVYYLRKLLMNALAHPRDGIGWKTGVIHHHPKSAGQIRDGVVVDFGFFHHTTNASRTIRGIPITLFINSKLDNANNLVWYPLNITDSSTDYDAQGGWKNGTNKWGVIWRFEYNQETFYNPSGSPRTFLAPGNYVGTTVKFHKFNFSNNPATLTQTGTLTLTSSDYNPYIDTTTISVPNVNGHPTFIEF